MDKKRRALFSPPLIEAQALISGEMTDKTAKPAANADFHARFG